MPVEDSDLFGSPWEDDIHNHRDVEWSKISSEFTNAGYREGITAGKEAALQQGFDDGYAQAGAPIGRELGILRGIAAAIVSFLNTSPSDEGTQADLLVEARKISKQLAEVRFSDVVPRDLEAEAHAREHLELDDGEEGGYDEGSRRGGPRREEIEDMLGSMSIGDSSRRTEDLQNVKQRLETLAQMLGLDFAWTSS